MAGYPIFLELAGKRIIVIGSGSAAVKKIQTLLRAGARVVVIAESIDTLIPLQSSGANIELIKSKYSKEYLAGALLVIAFTDRSDLNRQIYKDCQQLEILCNIADDAEHCDFYLPAVVKRGPLQVAVAAEVSFPAFTGHIRKKLEAVITEDHGRFLDALENIRRLVTENISDSDDRKVILGRLADDASFDYFKNNGPEKWKQFAQKIIEEKDD